MIIIINFTEFYCLLSRFGDYVSFSNTVNRTDLIFGPIRQWASDEATCYPLSTGRYYYNNKCKPI